MNFYGLLKYAVKLFIPLVFILIILIQPLPANSNDWTQWRGSNRDGISTEKGWSTKWSAEGPKQLWKISVGTGYSSMAVVGDCVYTLGNTNQEDTIYCIDANKGSVIWKYSYPCAAEGNGYPGPASTPTIVGNSMYTLSREGHLFCLDTKTGSLKWSKHVQNDYGAKTPDWQFASSPVIHGKMVLLAVGKTIAVDKDNGNLIWQTKDYNGGYSTPNVFKHGNKEYLASFNTLGLVIHSIENGQEIANAEWKTDWNVNAATPIVYGDNIFVSSGYNVGGGVFQFDGKALKQIWKNKNMRNHFNSCVLWNDYLYGVDEDQLRCLDFQTGAVKWTKRGLGKGSLMVADGKLIVLGEKGDLVIADAIPDKYSELANAKVLGGLCWTVPVLSNGKIFCRNHEGDLVCLDVR